MCIPVSIAPFVYLAMNGVLMKGGGRLMKYDIPDYKKWYNWKAFSIYFFSFKKSTEAGDCFRFQ